MKLLRIALGGGVILLSTGCATSIGDRSLPVGNMLVYPAITAAEQEALRSGKTDDGNWRHAQSRFVGALVQAQQCRTDASRRAAALDEGACSNAYADFWNAGRNAAQVLCEKYFMDATREQVRRELRERTYDDTRLGVQALQGIYDVSGRVVSITSFLADGMKRANDTYETVVLPTVNMGALHQVAAEEFALLDQASGGFAGKSPAACVGKTDRACVALARAEQYGIDTDPAKLRADYYSVERNLLRYHRICTLSNLKRMVNERLTKATETSASAGQ